MIITTNYVSHLGRGKLDYKVTDTMPKSIGPRKFTRSHTWPQRLHLPMADYVYAHAVQFNLVITSTGVV